MDDKTNRGLSSLALIAILSFIVACWATAFALVKYTNMLMLPMADLATLTFGASSLFLFMFSFGLGVLGVIGWQSVNIKLRDLADQAAASAADRRLMRVENEMRGRAYSTIGYITGEMSLRYEDGLIKVIDRERLAEAVATLRQGHEFLSQIKDEKAEFMVLNNLVFYSLMQGNQQEASFLLEKAEDLMRVGKAHDAPNLMLTASGVFAFHGVNEIKMREVIMLLEDLKNSPRLSIKRRGEAKYYIALASTRVKK